MRFHGIDVKGKFHVQRVESKPTWTSDDEGRIIYVEDERILYYGSDEMWLKSSGSGFNPVYVDSDYTADVQDLCLVDTRNGMVTITLPPNPKDGGEIKIVDTVGAFESNPCVINRNGKTIMRHEKNLALDTNDLITTLTFDKSAINDWKCSFTGVAQIVGHATLFVHKHIEYAQNLNGNGGQELFSLPFKYNTAKDNISVYVDGKYISEFQKTNTQAITLNQPVAEGTEVVITSIPIESGFNINKFITESDLDLFVKQSSFTNQDILDKVNAVAGPGSSLNADLLDGREGNTFVYVEDYTDGDVLTKIRNVDGHGSGLDADTLDSYHPSDSPTTDPTTRQNKIPVGRSSDGKLDPSWMPFGQGGVEYQNSFDIPVGNPSTIDIADLDNEAGYMITFTNIVPTNNDVKLYAKAWNETDNTWDVFESWSLEYSNHLAGPLRDFNTNSDMILADSIGNGTYGFNGTLWVTGFSATNGALMKTVRSDIHFLSSIGSYASFYRGIGAISNNAKAYTGLRLFFEFGDFAPGGNINILKFNNSVE